MFSVEESRGFDGNLVEEIVKAALVNLTYGKNRISERRLSAALRFYGDVMVDFPIDFLSTRPYNYQAGMCAGDC